MKKLLPLGFLVFAAAFFGAASFVSANLAQVELQPQSSFTCNATGTIYYSLSNNQLMLCTSGSGAHPVLTGSGGTSASFSTITVSGTSTFATSGGNVGIGTTNPLSQLDVAAATSTMTLSSGGSIDLYFEGSSANNKIDSRRSNDLLFQINGATKMVLQGSSGNVGIGTTTPSSLLQIQHLVSNNGLTIGAGGYGTGLSLWGNTADGTIMESAVRTNMAFTSENTAAGGIEFNNGNTSFYGDTGLTVGNTYTPSTRMFIGNTGNVGIGTTTPTTAGLVVSTNVSGAAVDVNNNRIVNVGTPISANDAATKNYVDSAIGTGGGGTSTGSFATLSVSGTTTLATVSGRVGIGTTNPQALLHVNGVTRANNRIDFYNGGGSILAVQIGSNDDIGLTGGGTTTSTAVKSQGNFAVAVNNGTTPSFFINSSGNVGIGTTSPANVLDVNGNISLVGYVAGDGAAGTAMQLYGSYHDSAGQSLAIKAGNVGIGTSTPGTNLDVNGNIQSSIYYDRANTNYYLNPSANIMPYALNTAGSIHIGTGQNSTANEYVNSYSTATGTAQYGGNWTAGGTWGIGPATGNSDQTIRIGNTSAGGTTWSTTQSLNLAVGGSITAGGNVGIGTTNTPYALSVAGSMYSIEVDRGTVTATTTLDWSASNVQTAVLGAATIPLVFNNGQPGGHYTLALKQDATGGRAVSWPSNVRWSSGVAPTLTTTASKTDYVEFVYDGLSSTFDGVGFNANF